jgi:hypothetical protein
MAERDPARRAQLIKNPDPIVSSSSQNPRHGRVTTTRN